MQVERAIMIQWVLELGISCSVMYTLTRTYIYFPIVENLGTRIILMAGMYRAMTIKCFEI